MTLRRRMSLATFWWNGSRIARFLAKSLLERRHTARRGFLTKRRLWASGDWEVPGPTGRQSAPRASRPLLPTPHSILAASPANPNPPTQRRAWAGDVAEKCVEEKEGNVSKEGIYILSSPLPRASLPASRRHSLYRRFTETSQLTKQVQVKPPRYLAKTSV